MCPWLFGKKKRKEIVKLVVEKVEEVGGSGIYKLWRLEKPNITPADFLAFNIRGTDKHFFAIIVPKDRSEGTVPSPSGKLTAVFVLDVANPSLPNLPGVINTTERTWLVTPEESLAKVWLGGTICGYYQILRVYNSDYWYEYAEGYEWNTYAREAK